MKKLLLLFIGGIICAAAFAEVRMSNLFTDHMVLQRGKPVPVWGTAKPGAEIDVVFGDEKRTVQANEDGEWIAVLKAMKANSDPQDLEIYENGSPARKISDVLVGEVWIASGQSNMEWPTRNTTCFEDAKKRAENGYPELRFFYQPIWNISDKPQEFASEQSSWYVCMPDRIDYSTAVGFYFAEQLMKDLDVPVGIIQAAAGGSSMRSWIPQESLTEVEYLTKDYLEFKKQQAEFDYPAKLAEWKKLAADYDAAVKAAETDGKPAPEKPEGYDAKPQLCSPRHVNESPSFHYNSNISHLRDFPVRGVIWYQGESDSWGELLKNFIPQLKTLVEAWRKQFNDDVYFYTVQITSWKHGQFWPETRWQQLQAKNEIKNFNVINTIDLGDEDDIHPHNKTDVGLRLEKLVLREVYDNKKARPYAPLAKDFKYDNDSVTVSFDMQGRKFAPKGEPRGFEVKVGSDWVEAIPQLKKNAVKVSSKNGEKISGVRYLWKPWALPYVWLYNEDGLPAWSFTNEQ